MEQSSNEKIRKPGGENSSSSQTGLQSTPHRIIRQQAWQHIILLIVLGYEGAGALLGGILLIAAPDGRLMDMPVNILHGVFIDFLIPGFILSGMGILTTLAFIAVLSRTPSPTRPRTSPDSAIPRAPAAAGRPSRGL